MRAHPTLESLEEKIAPAGFSFVDVDGDQVTITSSKGTAAQLQAALTLVPEGLGQELRKVDFANNTVFAGTTLSIVSKPAGTNGDGFVNVGQIDASGIDLANVTVDGDLASLAAGDAIAKTKGLGTLTVLSLGRLDNETGTAFNSINVTGDAAGIVVKSSIHSAGIAVTTLGKLIVGGGVFGSSVFVTNLTNATIGSDAVDTRIQCQTIGSLTIKGSLLGINSPTISEGGQIETFGNAGAIKVFGDVSGASGFGSGQIRIGGNVTTISIGGDLTAGDAANASFAGGIVDVTGNAGMIFIGGNLEGGGGGGGRIEIGDGATGGKATKIAIAGSVVGTAAAGSGVIQATNAVGMLAIEGSLIGGDGLESGSIQLLATAQSVSIGGSIVGGGGAESGMVLIQNSSNSFLLKGSLLGGTGTNSGALEFDDGLTKSVRVLGSLVGGSGVESASIDFDDRVGSVFVGGSVIGGGGNDSGNIEFDDEPVTSVRILGSLTGGAGIDSGTLEINAGGGSVFIGGSLVGGTGNSSGMIDAADPLTKLEIRGSIRGGSASGSNALTNSGSIEGTSVQTMIIGGSVIAGTDATSGNFLNNGAIRFIDRIGALTIEGSVVGNTTAPVLITGGATLAGFPSANLVALGNITILGHVQHASILAGYNTTGTTLNGDGNIHADAQIGTVRILGDMIATNIAAGVSTGPNNLFGDADDTATGIFNDPAKFSRIASVVVLGQADGTAAAGDGFGITAQEIVKVQVGDRALPLDAGPGDAGDSFFLGFRNPVALLGVIGTDYRVREVAVP